MTQYINQFFPTKLYDRSLAIAASFLFVAIILPLQFPVYIGSTCMILLYMFVGYFSDYSSDCSTAAALSLAIFGCTALVIQYTMLEILDTEFQFRHILWVLPLSFITQLIFGKFFISVGARIRSRRASRPV